MTQQEASEGKNDGGSAVPRPKVFNCHPPIKASHTKTWWKFKIGETTFQYPKATTTFEGSIHKHEDTIWLIHLYVYINGKFSHIIYLGSNTLITF